MWSHKYVGLPFVDGGRTMKGVDCWGLVRLIYDRELEIELPSYGDTSARDLIKISRSMTTDKDAEIWENVDRSKIMAFDVVVMRFSGKHTIGHVGVMVDSKNVMHVEASTAAVIVPLDHWLIRERLECYRRHKNFR